ncbi:MAG: DUF192 domain-containing protein [Gammaproteobacteria bacterium]|nr:MAG: DUF192 domain-containing protein [Gammaproteobacteria bacterium]TLY71045.1 MAG: DUF192 domain-containing protein [Gammaproteobacteria bacterium]
MSSHDDSLSRARTGLSALLLVLSLVVLPVAVCSAQSQSVQDLATFPRTTLEITPAAKSGHHPKKNDAQSHRFEVWIADTPERQQQGLMFVRDLPGTQGMLFPQDPPRVANFWMKNTYIELDMVFIGTDGHIIKTIEHAQPFKLDSLSSDRPVSAVLELKGGEAAKLGVRVGDLVSWSPPR